MEETGKTSPELERMEQRVKNMESALAQSFAAFSKLQEREERYRLLVENLPDAAWTTDGAGHTVYISPQVEDIYGFTSEEVLAGGDELWFGRVHPDDVERVRTAFERMMDTGSAFDVEYRIRHKSGPWIWLHDRAFTRTTKEGTRFAHGIFRDITQQKLAEADLQTKDAAVSSSINAIAFGDLAGIITYVNASFLRQWGYTRPEDVVGRPATEFWQMPEAASTVIATLHEQGGWSGELTACRKDGSLFLVQLTATRVQDSRGRPLCLMASFLDITERKRTEAAVAASEAKYRMLFESSTDGIFLLDLEGNFIDANRTAYERLGYTREEFLSLDINRLDDPAFADKVPERLRQIRERGMAVFESGHLRKDGSMMPVEVNSRLLDYEGMKVFFSVIRDITERKKADEALHREKNKTDAILAAMGDGLSIQDRNYRVLYQNDAHKALIGDHAGELCYAGYERRDSLCESCPVALAFHDGKVHTIERSAPTDRGTLHVEITASPLRDPDGTIVAGIEVVRDITQRKRAEEDRHRSQEQAQFLIDHMPVGCIMWDTEFRAALWNPAAERIFGYPAPDALGRHAYDLVVPKEARAASDAVWQRLLAGDQVARAESENITRDGRKIVCEWYNTPIRDSTGRVTFVLSMMMDLSDRQRAEEERRKLEGQLLQSQKMEAIGLLAGGIAHDFNNILSAILGYASIVQMKMGADDPLRPHVDQVLAASQRAASLTQGLLAFSRKQIINPQALLVNESLRKIEKLLRRIIGEDIEFKTVYAEPDMTVMADAGQLEQVIINLATNARDAMPRGGTITLETCRAEIDADFIRKHGYGKAGAYALIMVSDTGTGMDEKTRMRIFEPFFTTKELGKGTGLGLSTAYGVVKQNNGYISCSSEPGSGTAFRVLLPLVKTLPRRTEAAASDTVALGTETVLIAEDDQAMRGLFGSLLADHGYTVIAAVDGDDAIAKFREHSRDIQLIVLDVVMPKKNGREVYDEARRIRPGIKAIFTSGYSADMVSRKGILLEGLPFLSKPVVPAEFLNKVRQVLDGR